MKLTNDLMVSVWNALSPTGGEQAGPRSIVRHVCCVEASCKHFSKKQMLLTVKMTERNPVPGDKVDLIVSSHFPKMETSDSSYLSQKISFVFV